MKTKSVRHWLTASEARNIIDRDIDNKIINSVNKIVTEIEKSVELKKTFLSYIYHGDNVDEVCSELKKLGYSVDKSYRNYNKFVITMYW